MGVGDSLDALGTFTAPVPAGVWHLVGDAQILAACDVRYSFRQRRAGASPGTFSIDRELVSFTHHFEPRPGGNINATLYEEDFAAPAFNIVVGDQLVWRYQILGSLPDGGVKYPAYIPNGDGPYTQGRYPSITVPK